MMSNPVLNIELKRHVLSAILYLAFAAVGALAYSAGSWLQVIVV